MALSDNPKEKDRKRPIRSALETSNKRWSDKQKMEAITSYLVLGNLALVSRLMNIPEITLRIWKASDWWKEVVDDLKSQERIELSNKMKKIVDAAHQVVENRLLNGDPVVLKDGSVISKPVAMKDAHRVAVDLLNQRDTLERVNKPVEERASSDEEKLKQLAEKFATFATMKLEQNLDKKRTVEMDIQDVEVVHSGGNALDILPSDEGRVQSLDEGTQDSSTGMAQ
jgi:hypothetical protein